MMALETLRGIFHTNSFNNFVKIVFTANNAILRVAL